MLEETRRVKYVSNERNKRSVRDEVRKVRGGQVEGRLYRSCGILRELGFFSKWGRKPLQVKGREITWTN